MEAHYSQVWWKLKTEAEVRQADVLDGVVQVAEEESCEAFSHLILLLGLAQTDGNSSPNSTTNFSVETQRTSVVEVLGSDFHRVVSRSFMQPLEQVVTVARVTGEEVGSRRISSFNKPLHGVREAYRSGALKLA